VPAVIRQLDEAGLIERDCLTVSGRTIGEIASDAPAADNEVIRTAGDPLKHGAGFVVLSGNFFDSAIMKMSVVGDAFRKTYLSAPGAENMFEARAIVFDGPEDYHARINDPSLEIDEQCILVIRGCGTVGYPGSAEVVNIDQARHRFAALHGRRPAKRHVREPVDSQHVARSGCRRRSRAAAHERQDSRRSERAQRERVTR
jgi:dihydroxyacid dehydratase/phosphogluconate dehydratase